MSRYTFAALVLLLLPLLAEADTSYKCLPKQVAGGRGSVAAWGVSISDQSAWAGWWCQNKDTLKWELQLLACKGTGCLPTLPAALSVSSANAVLNDKRTGSVFASPLLDVWAPHAKEIDAVRPQ